MIQTWVVTGGPLIASFYVAKYVFNTNSGQLKNGRHTVTYDDRGNYEGALRDGKRHGYGTYTWSDGRRHIGEWFADEEHGRGTLTGVSIPITRPGVPALFMYTTSDRFDTWFILSGTTGSRQYHESTMV